MKLQGTLRFELSGPDVFHAHTDASISERERESLDGGQMELALTSLEFLLGAEQLSF